jgi:flagellar hook-associated protein 2
VTSGTFTLNGVVFNVDASKDTLDDVLNRINNSSAGVTATFNPATEGITLIQKNTGSANKIVLGASGDTSNLLYALQLSNNNPPQGGQADTISGTDTKLSFNGGAVQSFGSNQITSLIPGVTVSAEGLGTAQLTIGADVNSMVSTIQNFVTDYNDLMDFITSKITESSGDTTDSSGNTIAASDSTDPTVRIQGTFNGDENFSETKDKLTSIVSSVVSGLSSTMNQLAQIGITTSSDNDGETGDLVLNVSQLTTALTNNSAGVAALFNTSGTGIMSQIHNEITALSDSATGAFTTEQNMFNTENADLDQQVSDMENTMVQKEAAYRQEFADLEQLASSYTSIGNNISKLLGVSAS